MKTTLSMLLTALIAAAASPAEQKIQAAKASIAAHPKSAQGYVDLAFAFTRRAREISDVSFYDQAQTALQKALQLEPTNFAAAKAEVWILLGKHEFAKARDKARALNQRMPDDVLTYGFLADANAELGDYDEAEKAVQWMLNLRPGNIPALTRTAYLRELFGDLEGAFDAMRMAFEATSPVETEDRAWILTQLAHVRIAQGRINDAERLLSHALAIFPGYHYALANLAKVRIEQKRCDEAVALLRSRFQAAPHAENLYALAEALELAGRLEEARRAFADFEKQSRAEMMRPDNSNHELVFYYTDHARRPVEALRVAQIEFDRRHDVYTLDAYAWALHANGRDAEARAHMERALAVGIRNREILAHAVKLGIRNTNLPSVALSAYTGPNDD
jgi:tetratricopeptide (TPR) repeat protein